MYIPTIRQIQYIRKDFYSSFAPHFNPTASNAGLYSRQFARKVREGGTT